MIARSPNLRVLYDDQAKAELDRLSELKGAREEGEAIGRINLLEELLGLPATDESDLADRTLPELQALVDDLRGRLSKRSLS